MAPEVRFELTTVRASIENADVSRSRVARLEFCQTWVFCRGSDFPDGLAQPHVCSRAKKEVAPFQETAQLPS